MDILESIATRKRLQRVSNDLTQQRKGEKVRMAVLTYRIAYLFQQTAKTSAE
jgi:hypothetical protein